MYTTIIRLSTIKKFHALLLIALGTIIGLASDTGAAPPGAVSEGLRQKARQTLSTALEKEEGWSKVHAAESLLSLDYPQGVAQTFERELALKGDEPKYRIGIWRVLARASPTDQQREQWINKIRAAFLDAAGQIACMRQKHWPSWDTKCADPRLKHSSLPRERDKARWRSTCDGYLPTADK